MWTDSGTVVGGWSISPRWVSHHMQTSVSLARLDTGWWSASNCLGTTLSEMERSERWSCMAPTAWARGSRATMCSSQSLWWSMRCGGPWTPPKEPGAHWEDVREIWCQSLVCHLSSRCPLQTWTHGEAQEISQRGARCGHSSWQDYRLWWQATMEPRMGQGSHGWGLVARRSQRTLHVDPHEDHVCNRGGRGGRQGRNSPSIVFESTWEQLQPLPGWPVNSPSGQGTQIARGESTTYKMRIKKHNRTAMLSALGTMVDNAPTARRAYGVLSNGTQPVSATGALGTIQAPAAHIQSCRRLNSWKNSKGGKKGRGSGRSGKGKRAPYWHEEQTACMEVDMEKGIWWTMSQLQQVSVPASCIYTVANIDQMKAWGNLQQELGSDCNYVDKNFIMSMISWINHSGRSWRRPSMSMTTLCCHHPAAASLRHDVDTVVPSRLGASRARPIWLEGTQPWRQEEDPAEEFDHTGG